VEKQAGAIRFRIGRGVYSDQQTEASRFRCVVHAREPTVTLSDLLIIPQTESRSPVWGSDSFL